jgi:hypothetical protein
VSFFLFNQSCVNRAKMVGNIDHARIPISARNRPAGTPAATGNADKTSGTARPTFGICHLAHRAKSRNLLGRAARGPNMSLRGAKRRGNLGFCTALHENRDCFASLAMTRAASHLRVFGKGARGTPRPAGLQRVFSLILRLLLVPAIIPESPFLVC